MDDTLEGLRSMFDDVYTEDFKKEYDIKCQNCKTQWKERYADYKTKTLEGEYLDMMKQIAEG